MGDFDVQVFPNLKPREEEPDLVLHDMDEIGMYGIAVLISDDMNYDGCVVLTTDEGHLVVLHDPSKGAPFSVKGAPFSVGYVMSRSAWGECECRPLQPGEAIVLMGGGDRE